MSVVLGQLFTGLSIASILLLAAIGLSFTFGQMGVINMAHGELIMAGAYIPFVLATKLAVVSATSGAALLLALPVAFVVAGTIGLIMERLLLRRLYGRPLDTLLVTFGVSLILQQVARDLFGAPNVNVPIPRWLAGNWRVLGVTMPHTRVFIIVLVITVVVIVALWMERSAAGRRMQAVVQNRNLAAVSGIPTRRIDARTFFLGSGLAGIAGVAVSLIGAVGFQIGRNYIVDAFLVVIVGGLGRLRGTVLAAVALGVLGAFTEWSAGSSMGKVVVLVAVIIFLQFRPNGLVALRTRGLAT